jgi:hypothetical protein
LAAGWLGCAGGASERPARVPPPATAAEGRTAGPGGATEAPGTAAPADTAGGAIDDPILGRWVELTPEEQRVCRATGTFYEIARDADGLVLRSTWHGGIGVFTRVLRGRADGDVLRFDSAAPPGGGAPARAELRRDGATGTLGGTFDGRPVRLYRPIPDPPDCPPAARLLGAPAFSLLLCAAQVSALPPARG